MRIRRLAAPATLAVTAAMVAAPAASAHVDVAVGSVKAHTDRADAALDRAVALFERNRDRRATRTLVGSRRQVGQARAETARLRRQADTPRERGRAARAQAVVARQQGADVEELLGALDDADGRVESLIARAALADTRGRDKAIAVIEAIVERGLPAVQAAGLSRALAALAGDRGDEVEAGAAALTSEDVSRRAKRPTARAVAATVRGQSRAAERLAELIAGDDVPERGKAGLQRAYDEVTADHDAAAASLEGAFDSLPAFVRSFVERVVAQAREDGTQMRENRPDPPAPDGQPDGTPNSDAAPDDTSSPDDDSSGDSESGSQPDDTPSGPPSETPPSQGPAR